MKVMLVLVSLTLVHGQILDDAINPGENASMFEHITDDNHRLRPTHVETADIPELLIKNGYPVERHVVETVDGYLITIYRIPHGRRKSAQPSKNVVVLFRALFCSTIEYLYLGPEKAIGYVLADMGYDVWMVEHRGNSYSRGHVTLSPYTAEFWDMSWDDMGRYDVPAAIEYVLFQTGVDKVIVAGHSMGTTTLFVGLSVNPWINKKVRLMIALAPVAIIAHLGGVLGFVTKIIPTRFWSHIPYHPLMVGEIVDVLYSLEKAVCGTEITDYICDLVIYLLEQITVGTFKTPPLSGLIPHSPDSDSTKTLIHYMQIMKSGMFRRYDYDSLGNIRKYNRTTPPEYDLSQITAPVALFGSEGDIFCNLKDCVTLASKLPNVAVLQFTRDKSFQHLDFVDSIDAPEQVYQHMYSVMEEY